jgi:hypothetical protein
MAERSVAERSIMEFHELLSSSGTGRDSATVLSVLDNAVPSAHNEGDHEHGRWTAAAGTDDALLDLSSLRSIPPPPHMVLWHLNATTTPPAQEDLRREFNALALERPEVEAGETGAVDLDSSPAAAAGDAAPSSEITAVVDQLTQGMEFLRRSVRKYVDLRGRVEALELMFETVRGRCSGIHRDADALLEQVREVLPSEVGHVQECVSNLRAFISIMEDVMIGGITRELTHAKHEYQETSKGLYSMMSVYQQTRCMSSSYSCPVCLSDSVSVYVVPCGHTFCRKCAPGTGSDMLQRCFLCRSNVIRINHMYFSG